MKKRIFSIILILSLATSVLAGCSKKATNDKNDSNSDADKTYRIAVLLSGYRGDGAYNDYVYEECMILHDKHYHTYINYGKN